MTAQSNTLLSELKMTSFGPYTGAMARPPSIALSTALFEGHAKCPTVPQLCELVIGTRVAGQSSK